MFHFTNVVVFEVLEQAKCYKPESLDARPTGNLRLT